MVQVGGVVLYIELLLIASLCLHTKKPHSYKKSRGSFSRAESKILTMLESQQLKKSQFMWCFRIFFASITF